MSRATRSSRAFSTSAASASSAASTPALPKKAASKAAKAKVAAAAVSSSDADATLPTDRKRKRRADSDAALTAEEESLAATTAASAPVAATAPKSRGKKAKASTAAAAAAAPMTDVDESAAPDEADADAAPKKKQPRAKSQTASSKSTESRKSVASAPMLLEDDGSNGSFKFGTISREFERALIAEGLVGEVFVGVDEAGRGPLAGPVVCAAVYAPLDVSVAGVNDSKKLSEEEREKVFADLTGHKDIMYAVSVLEHTVVDEINILEATMRGMSEAVEGVVKKLAARKQTTKPVTTSPFFPAPAAAAASSSSSSSSSSAAAPAVAGSSTGTKVDLVLVDGNRIPKRITDAGLVAQAVVKGDSKVFTIAAASIIAKVTRDRLMHAHDVTWPQYGFGQHKGYGVGSHMSAIYKHGPCPIHRMTFAPMKNMKPRTTTTTTITAAAAAAAAAATEEEPTTTGRRSSKRK